MQEQSYQKQKIKLSTWRQLLEQEGHRKKYFILILACGMAMGVSNVLSSLLNMYIIDHFLATKQLQGFIPIAVLVVLTQLCYAVTAYGFGSGAGKLEAHLTADVRFRCFEKLQTMSFSYFDKTSVGHLLSRLTSDVSRTMETISWSSSGIGFGIVFLIASIVCMFLVNSKLAVIVLLSVPPMALVSIFFQRKILKHHRETRRLNSMITSAFNEGITGAVTTKVLVRERENFREFAQTNESLKWASYRASAVSALYLPVASLLISFATATVLYRGGMDVLHSALTIGQLNFFITVSGMMFDPIRNFAGIFAEFQSSQAAAERVADVLSAHSDITDTERVTTVYGDLFQPKRENWEAIRGDVTFDHVTFSYDDNTVLRDFCLDVKAGETIALVGETGSGKSTIVNLICRFYEPQEGKILIDGKDVQERSQLWLQSSLGYVLQTPHLFSGTIRENIQYGNLEATEEEICAAAALVGADSFIEKLEQGYDTQVGEGGGLLSTGQKQLISFARAILANPRIFVLDEATSSIDTETELQIQAAIETLLESRTSFVVAHRLSTIRNADRILVIENGKIVEQGSHSELLKQRGRYFELYQGHSQRERLEESIHQLA